MKTMKNAKITKEGKPTVKKENYTLTAKEVEEQRQFIQQQQEYIKVVWSRIYTQEELKEMQNQLVKGPIKMQWFGMTYPKQLLEVEYEMKRHAYKIQVREEERLKRELVAQGLTMDDLKELWKTQIIKEKHPQGKKQ